MKLDIILHDIDGEGYLCIRLADLTLLKRKRFTPPTLDEVKAYCQAKHKNVDPVKWWNFYNAKGWMIGKTKMAQWKSAVATWDIVDTQPESKGTNLAPKWEPTPLPAKGAPMPDSLKKRLGNIGKESN